MSEPNFTTRLDCRLFRGDAPCSPGALCEGCSKFEPIGKRILVIKLGALGDVLRTTPILDALRRESGPCHITWVVDELSHPLLVNNPHIGRLVVFGPEAIVRVMVERFDVVYSLDKHPGAAGLATLARAGRKVGFVLDATSGNISCEGESAAYAYRLGLDDDLKFRRNTKTYQQMTFEMLGLEWRGQNYIFNLSDKMRELGRGVIENMNFEEDGPAIGLVTGSGEVWPMKRWTVEHFAALADRLVEKLSARVMLLGAERDRARNIEIQTAAHFEHPLAPHNMGILEFAGLIGACDAIVTGDTAAMHIGLAMGVPTVALFGPTSAREVEMYRCGRAIVAPLECSPCYRSSCKVSPTCMELITVEDVFVSLMELMELMNDD